MKKQQSEKTQLLWNQQQFCRFLKNNVPPGLKYGQEIRGILLLLALAATISLVFLLRLGAAYGDLFQWAEEERVLIAGAVMPDFSALLGVGTFSGFLVIAWIPPANAVVHYRYYYQDSKSIYLMRRLPNRFELHRRALFLPLLELLLVGITAFLLLVLYYNIYLLATPSQCLVPGQWQKLWR